MLEKWFVSTFDCEQSMRSLIFLSTICLSQFGTGQDTPEAVFKKMFESKKAGDWDAVFSLMTTEGRRKTMDDYVLTAIISRDPRRNPEFTKKVVGLFKKYGIEGLLPKGDGSSIDAKATNNACVEVFKQLGMNDIEFVKELDLIFMGYERDYFHACHFFDSDFIEVDTKKDSATAKIKYRKVRSMRTVKFRKIKGKWKFDGIQNRIFGTKKK